MELSEPNSKVFARNSMKKRNLDSQNFTLLSTTKSDRELKHLLLNDLIY